MWLSLCCLLWSWAFVSGQCPEKYERFSLEHTFCKTTPSSCSIVNTGVSEADKELILRMHNEYRSRVASGSETLAGGLPQASKMLQFVWDDELASIAQKLTETCKYGHDCNACRTTPTFEPGQNIGKVWYPGGDPPSIDWASFLKSLYDEVEHFHYNKIKPFVPSSGGDTKYGHFTQMVWDTTWTVGCGLSQFRSGGDGVTYYACNYGPGGNMPGGEMYKVGPKASECPGNSRPSYEYDGLCKVIDSDQSPEGGVVPPGYAFFCNFAGQEDCRYDVKGQSGWTLNRNRGGNYIQIVLKGGESTTLEFQKPLRTSGPALCFAVSVRRQPAFLRDYMATEFAANIGPMYINYSQSQSPNTWTSFIRTKSTLPIRKNADYKLSFEFTVPPGSPRQIVEVKKIEAKECS